MGLKNCPECGKLYMENPSNLCPACYALEEEAEQKVADYVRDVNRASVQQIVEATGVKERIVYRMIRAGRLYNATIEYACENCGKLIMEGRLCPACNQKLVAQMKPEPQPQAQAKPPLAGREKKMYTKDLFTK